ncbi:hypothetical protein HK44_018860 [Pseudomonas fluorescens HK44]|uniref:Uncharacterized protein n=1 Tax=Pseudomonas fluorescens HK44 TaxID=1042209 RepID=A0A010SDP2_PSEFL|nr:hypothetical protein HK44_018860 [Pseudomonas fluorescens HK44]
MVNKNLEDLPYPQWPEAAQTLMALMHAQGEVARLQQEIQRLSFSHHGQTFGITVSQGLTSLMAEDETLDNPLHPSRRRDV